MTRRLLPLALLFALLPGLVPADTIRMRSGEHGEFTRLVLDVPTGQGWSLESPVADQTYRLVLEGPPSLIDYDSVFDRITRNRVTAIAVPENVFGLDIALACDCEIRAFQFTDRMVVLDVRDREAGPDAPEEEGIAEAPSWSAASRAVGGLTALSLGPAPRIGPAPVRNVSLPDILYGATFAAPEPAMAGGPAQARLSSLSREISQSVADAATRGLLDAAIDPATLGSDGNPPPQAASPDPARQAQAPQITVKGNFDLAEIDRGRVRIGGSSCVDAAALDLGAWATDAPMSVQLGQLLRQLTGEFDRLDTDILSMTARLYLHFGFGAEAIATNAMLEDAADPVVSELGRIVDEIAPLAGIFSGQADCETPAALWAVLSGGEDLEMPINVASVQRAFEELPLHLRRHLGPTLAEKLSEFSERDAAEAILSRLRRATGQDTETMRLAQARIDLEDGETELARRNLKAIARTGGAAGPDAVVAISELAADEDAILPSDIVEIADAYATELRGTETGGDLWLARIRGLADSGRYAEAFASVAASEDVALERRDQARADLTRSVISSGSDVDFLKHVLNGDVDPGLRLGSALALDAAERLLDLGLLEQSLALSRAGPAGRGERAKILAARALLALSRPEDAEIELIGLGGEAVLRLRADARIRMGDYDYAQSALNALGERETALDAAWIAGDLETIALAEDGPRSEASQIALNEEPGIDPDAAPSLVAASRLADSSRSVRATLDALLEDTRILRDGERDGG